MAVNKEQKIWGNEKLTLSQYTFFGFDVVFELSRSEPNFHTLTHVLNRIGENDFGVIGGLVFE